MRFAASQAIEVASSLLVRAIARRSLNGTEWPPIRPDSHPG
jgi:hypothetical protein